LFRERLADPSKGASVLSPILVSPVGLTVDPLLLAIAGRPLAEAATALRQALPGLDGAWLAAADALHRQRSGEALQACRPGTQRGLVACAEELETFSEVLRASATVYADAESVSVGSH
jgi:hypothetical protein